MPERYRTLIEKIIKNNSRYSGNEDLLEDFCSETFKRCYKILSSSDNIANFEAYLNKVATSAILDVLKNSGRIRRIKAGYQTISREPSGRAYATDEFSDIIYDVEDPSPSIEESLINQEEVRNIRNALQTIDEEHGNKQFLTIFRMRYIEGVRQSEIARKLGISQGEVSKRLIDLSKRILSRIHTV